MDTREVELFEDREQMMKTTNEEFLEKKKLILWVKEYQKQLLLLGFSVTTLIVTILGMKNKDTIRGLWDSLKEEIEKGPIYSAKWFEKSSLEELKAVREVV